VRKIIFILGLWLGLAGLAAAAEVNLSLTDGSTVQGELIKFDDNGIQLRIGETFTNLQWGGFSQESLKQLAQNPTLNIKKQTIAALTEPFIEPEISQRAPKPEIKINDVRGRLELPPNPSIFGGLLKSSVGKFIFFILFLANLYAAYEISIVKARPPAQVMGLSALLPIIGPIIFLSLPMQAAPVLEEHAEMAAPAGTQAAAAQASAANPEIEIGEASWKKTEDKKIEAQVFARGKFTFNKRFIETKFAGFVGTVPKGDAVKFWLEVKASNAHFGARNIASVGMAEAIFDTDNGQVTVPFADILEIKLNPRTE
jgi:hypothetical protein